MERLLDWDLILAMLMFLFCVVRVGQLVADALSPWKDDRLVVKRHHTLGG